MPTPEEATQKEIDNLNPDLKAVADKYLKHDNSPKYALEMALGQSGNTDNKRLEELRKKHF